MSDPKSISATTVETGLQIHQHTIGGLMNPVNRNDTENYYCLHGNDRDLMAQGKVPPGLIRSLLEQGVRAGREVQKECDEFNRKVFILAPGETKAVALSKGTKEVMLQGEGMTYQMMDGEKLVGPIVRVGPDPNPKKTSTPTKEPGYTFDSLPKMNEWLEKKHRVILSIHTLRKRFKKTGKTARAFRIMGTQQLYIPHSALNIIVPEIPKKRKN